MNAKVIEQICMDYDVTAQDLRIASAVQLTLADKMGTQTDTLSSVASKVSGLLNDTQTIDSIRWATWIKHARETNQEGRNFDELLKIRTEK